MTTIEKLPAQFRRNAEAADNQGLREVAEHLRYAAREVEQAEKPEPTTIEDKTIELSEVLAWADGIRGALGSEHANRVEDREARVAEAIREAHPLDPPARHGPRVNMAWPGAGEALAMTEAAVAAQAASMATDATCECGKRPREIFPIEHSETGHREWKLATHCTECLEWMAQPASENEIDEGAVDDFAGAMKNKLSKAREKGRSGWHDPMQCSGARLAEMLVEHVRKANPGNYVDIANLAMMLHHRREPAELAALAFENAAPRAISAELQEIVEELQRARQKFPGWPKDPIHAAQIVQEEAGELGRAVLQIAYEEGKATPGDARREAVQSAAMAIRFLEHFAAYNKAPAELVYYDR